MKKRQATLRRATRETRISLTLNLDGVGKASVKTGIPFLDHMLVLFAKHAVMDLKLRCWGDLEVDAHHTVEDCGLTLGAAFAQALEDKTGIRRYGTGFDPRNTFTGGRIPMDECLARCVIDFGGRPPGVAGHESPQKKLTAEEKSQDVSSAFRFQVGAGVFPGIHNERYNLHFELLYGDRITSHCGGDFQGVRPRGRYCMSTRYKNFWHPSQHEGKVVTLAE